MSLHQTFLLSLHKSSLHMLNNAEFDGNVWITLFLLKHTVKVTATIIFTHN